MNEACLQEVVERVPIFDAALTVEAMDDFEPMEPGELRLRKNDKVVVLHQDTDIWWTGILRGKVGRFPASIVNLVCLFCSLSHTWQKLNSVLGKLRREYCHNRIFR